MITITITIIRNQNHNRINRNHNHNSLLTEATAGGGQVHALHFDQPSGSQSR
eukprot:m.70130 g.70130  ORF g.70130 m.70130 type:complete len:52 (+) comp24180_c1_seq1:70-225(+)